MSSKLKYASAISVVATLITALVSADGSRAAAQVYETPAALVEPAIRFSADPVVQPVPQAESAVIGENAAVDADSLADLVEATPIPEDVSSELNCLAGAIYFEAKSESLSGQLAVGRVIVARSKSGRFPASYCGVVLQPSQFSFVRGRAIPYINRSSRDWQDAVRIAAIADSGSWKSPVEGALFFHAARVSPGWRLTRIARIDGHVFYR
jgi:spore germination cell wall hydrolase CwlJ-like protein